MVICGDALEVLKDMDTASVDCCVTSPPYYGLRDYGVDGQLGLEQSPEEYVAALVEVFHEVKRVLKDNGTLWLVIGDSYAGSGKGGTLYPDNALKYKQGTNRGMLGAKATAKTSVKLAGYKSKDLIGIPWMVAFALRADGWYLRRDIIWAKPNAMPESVKDRPTSSHEYIFLLSKTPHYYFDYEAIQEPAVNGDPNRPRGSTAAYKPNGGRRLKQDEVGKPRYVGFNGRYFSQPLKTVRRKRDVWTVNVKPYKGAHFATFPPNLVAPCVLAGAPLGGTVLDCFCGSGTVGVVCAETGRHFVGVELNPQYCEMADSRVSEAEIRQTSIFDERAVGRE